MRFPRTTTILISFIALLGAAATLIANISTSPISLLEWIKNQVLSPRPATLAFLVIIVLIAALQIVLAKIANAREQGAETVDPKVRADFLKKILAQRVDQRLEQGVRERIRVDLRLTETPAAVNSRSSAGRIGFDLSSETRGVS